MHLRHRSAPFVSLFVLATAGPAVAQDAAPVPAPAPPTVSEHVTVTATRIPEDAAEVPASITVVSGEELRDLGATDLRGALALAAGVDVVPGGDGGPAGAVPEIWGLRELDAFLLVVDGVPWGGPFAPDLATVNLADVERIELLRGSAPVMYGATSFSGVIQVVRKAAGAGHGSASARLGTHGSGAGSLSLELPSLDGWSSSLSLDGGHQGFDDPRTDWSRGHALWRSRKASGRGVWRFDVDASLVDQSPASPRPREGKALSPSVPVDANHNPDGAFLDRRRYSFAAGYDRQRAGGIWSTTLSYARSTSDALRGFLADLGSPQADAVGFRQEIGVNELYFDTHLEWTRSPKLRAVAGLDFLHGNGESEGFAFDYETPLDGSSATVPAVRAAGRRRPLRRPARLLRRVRLRRVEPEPALAPRGRAAPERHERGARRRRGGNGDEGPRALAHRHPAERQRRPVVDGVVPRPQPRTALHGLPQHLQAGGVRLRPGRGGGGGRRGPARARDRAELRARRAQPLPGRPARPRAGHVPHGLREPRGLDERERPAGAAERRQRALQGHRDVSRVARAAGALRPRGLLLPRLALPRLRHGVRRGADAARREALRDGAAPPRDGGDRLRPRNRPASRS